MSRNNNGKAGSKLQELRVSLTSRSRGGGGPAAGTPGGGGGGGGEQRRLSSSSSSSTASPPSSCVSSEGSPEAGAGAPMVLAGCPRCMMYVMLSREDPRCPKCNSAVLLDFVNDAGAGGNTNGRRV